MKGIFSTGVLMVTWASLLQSPHPIWTTSSLEKRRILTRKSCNKFLKQNLCPNDSSTKAGQRAVPEQKVNRKDSKGWPKEHTPYHRDLESVRYIRAESKRGILPATLYGTDSPVVSLAGSVDGLGLNVEVPLEMGFDGWLSVADLFSNSKGPSRASTPGPWSNNIYNPARFRMFLKVHCISFWSPIYGIPHPGCHLSWVSGCQLDHSFFPGLKRKPHQWDAVFGYFSCLQSKGF